MALAPRRLLILVLWFVATAWALCLPAWGATPASTWMLSSAQPTVDLQGQVDTWLESSRGASVQEVAKAKSVFVPHTLGQPFELSEGNTIWIRLRLQRIADETGHWMLSVPVPFLDFISLFQRDVNGTWTEQRAGDAVAHTEWSRQGLTPAFNLNLVGNAPQEVYLRVRNYTRADIPLRITTEDAHTHRQANESLALGWTLGLLMTFFGLSMVRFAQHRAQPDLAAAAYTVLVIVTVAQINGILNATLWQTLPVLANHANRVIAAIAVGGSLLYMRELYALSIHYQAK